MTWQRLQDLPTSKNNKQITKMFDVDKWNEIITALRKNKIRTALTAFGVFWGILMLMIMLGAGKGLEHGVLDGFKDFATNSAFVWTRTTTIPFKGFKRGRSFMLNNADMVALQNQIPEIDLLAPRLQGGGDSQGDNNVVRGLKTGAFSINGDYPQINLIDPSVIVKGRFIDNFDIQEVRKVCVIGTRVAEVLFDKNEDPIGKSIRIKGVYFQVIGVAKPKNPNISFGGDKEQTITLPFTTLQKTYNYGDVVHYFSVTARTDVPVSIVENKCLKFLANRHNVSPDDEPAFGHFNLQKQFEKMTGLFTGIKGLIWIVGIGTLLAGVIGVSNIMLVIVKERTKEIGIQRALGASPVKIVSQIITESVFLTSVAGYFGLVVGVGLVELANMATKGGDGSIKNPEVDFTIAIISLTILVVAGAFAGMIPARKAISIKPIDALRYE